MSIHHWQIAAAATIGVLVGGVAVYQLGHDAVRRVVSEPVDSFKQLIDGNRQPSPHSDKKPARQASEQGAAKTLRDQQARQLRADQQKAAGGGTSEALEAAARKERAWAKFYKQPAQCDGNPSSETMTECANHYIRAKRRFEESYAAGKL